MKLNTAILYDIENLIGGYGQADYLANLSLKSIYDDIVKIDFAEGIAIQRAYANWSNHRLKELRGDITELGIEPVQMFGFGKGSAKNASDIQLAIDAVDIAFTRPGIETFVIVSGDGGFSALAKKLHEYGKMVIGCAYHKATNRVFEAVCDGFIWITVPSNDSDDMATSQISRSSEPILDVFMKKFQPMNMATAETVLHRSKEVIGFFANYRDSQILMKTSGMNISIIHQALKHSFNDFSYYQCGFAKFVDFLRFVTYETKTKLVVNPPSDYRLVLNETHVSGFNDVEPITSIGEIHTTENYEKLLATGNPRIVLPSSQATADLSHFLVTHIAEMQHVSYGDILERLSDEFEYEQKVLKQTVTSLIQVGCFEHIETDQEMSEQLLRLKCQSVDEILRTLRTEMLQKLTHLLNEVDSEQFAEIILQL